MLSSSWLHAVAKVLSAHVLFVVSDYIGLRPTLMDHGRPLTDWFAQAGLCLPGPSSTQSPCYKTRTLCGECLPHVCRASQYKGELIF